MGADTVNASPGCEAKFLMMGYPLSSLQEGIYSNKQGSKLHNFVYFSDQVSTFTMICNPLGP